MSKLVDGEKLNLWLGREGAKCADTSVDKWSLLEEIRQMVNSGRFALSAQGQDHDGNCITVRDPGKGWACDCAGYGESLKAKHPESSKLRVAWETLREYANESMLGMTLENVNWLEHGGKGVCPFCDYGAEGSFPSGYDPRKEHSTTCLLVETLKAIKSLEGSIAPADEPTASDRREK